MEGATD